MISARIDKKLLQELELEASLGNMTKNKIINRALAMYLDLMDTKRRYSIMPDWKDRNIERDQFIVRWFYTNI